MPPLFEPGHIFSQHSLNTYLGCPRRFLLKYVDDQPWPVPEDEDPAAYRGHLERGRVLHQWLAREHLGLDMDPIAAASDDALLRRWWMASKAFDRERLPAGIREAELPVVVPLGDYGLYARYDLLAMDPGGAAVIVDWKTLETVPSLVVLERRMQTRVYLYTLVTAGQVLSGGRSVEPERTEMLYWFANHPDDEVVVPYSRRAYVEDERYLLGLAGEITTRGREAFVRTDRLARCARCNYASLCDRHPSRESAGDDWLDEDLDFALDLEQYPELEY